MHYLLGIDVGTSGTKTVLFDLMGNTVASATGEYPLYQPHPGWAEQDPEDWWRVVCSTVERVITQSGIPAADIRAIGLSGQMHGAVLLDRSQRVLRPAILWCDQRSVPECAQMNSLVGAERLREITANPALTGMTAAKLLWVKNHEPQIFERIDKVLLPKDYIRFRLTGEFATEVSDASGMQLMNVPQRCWSDEVLQKLGISKSWLGTLHESHEVSGHVSTSAARVTGLAAKTPVVGGAGDQAAGAIGNGIVQQGIVSSTIGSSGVVLAFMDQAGSDPLGRVQTFCHAMPNSWQIMGVTQGAGLSFRWLRDTYCQEEIRCARENGLDPYQLMTDQAAMAPPGSNGLLFLPYMMGERTPHLDPMAKGVFFGLSARHTRQDMLRAVMEGVVFSLKDTFEIFKELAVPVSEVRASGGGGASELWRQMQADIFDADICTVNTTEGPAWGAALLAAVGIGVYASIPQACRVTIRKVSTIEPYRMAAKKYGKYYPIYKALYPALRQSFKDLDAIIGH